MRSKREPIGANLHLHSYNDEWFVIHANRVRLFKNEKKNKIQTKNHVTLSRNRIELTR